MKVLKKGTVILLIILLTISWLSYGTHAIKKIAAISGSISKAEDSLNHGLYEQAIEFYFEALKERPAKKYYVKIKEIYEKFYQEEKTNYVRTHFIDDMLEAAEKYPKEAMFWNAAIGLQMDSENYRDAYKTAIKARNLGASDEQLNKYYKSLLYMVKIEYKLYNEFNTALNGYNAVSTGSNWFVIDNNGNKITEQYNYVGLVSDSGFGIYDTGEEVRLLDKNQITRARFGKLKITEAGYYSENANYFPVKIGEKWAYIDKDGKKLADGYDIAGSFYDHKAAACKDGKWEIIDDTGKVNKLDKFNDVKLDLYGSYIQGDIIIAKEGSKYHLYDTSWNKIGNFECDNIDICIDNNLIAFEKSGKWGFVDTKGKITVEPKYAKAKSFSNKYAAVCEKGALWGFINDKFELVIPCKYFDAHYFNKDSTCFISQGDGTYQLLRFMFD